MASELRVDKIVPVDGVPSGGGGGIVQVKQVIHSDYVKFSAGSSFTAGTSSGGNFAITITPTRSDSKILVSFNSMYDNNQAGQRAYVTLYRSIGGGTASHVLTGSGARGLFEVWNPDQRIQSTCMVQYLDTPSTTQAVTYTVYGYVHNSGGSGGDFYLGLYNNQKFMHAMEVSA